MRDHVVRLVVAAVAALMVTSTGAGSAVTRSGGASAANDQYADNDTAAQRHAETVAYAKQILAQRPVLDGEAPFTGTVPKKFEQPNEFPGASNRLGRTYYATVAQSPHRVFKEYSAATVVDSRLGGYGDVGAGDDGSRYAWVRFDRDVLPRTMVDGELIIEIQGYAHKPTLLSEFVWVVPHPAWRPAERIPATHPKVRITRTKFSRDHKVRSRRRIVLHPKAAVAVTTAFDNSWIAAPWTCVGGIFTPTVTYQVRVRSGGHRWRIQTPGFCGVSGVTRGSGHALPGVNVSKAFTKLVREDTRTTS
jgi:hypothetical protein